MKPLVKTILSAVLLLIAVPAAAEVTRTSVALDLPEDYVAKICPAPVWEKKKALWKGIEDKREAPEIGLQTKKKGRDRVYVDAAPPLTAVLSEALPPLFAACGIEFVKTGKADLVMSGEITEFYADVEKRLVTGKGKARSRLLFRLNRESDRLDRTVEIGYEIDAKTVRKRDIRQLKAALNDLLYHTLEQVPRLDGFKRLSRDWRD